MLPISTAMWDPIWYKGSIRKDKRGVWIGANDPRFHPPEDSDCLTCKARDSTKCRFSEQYYNKIKNLNLNEVTKTYQNIATALGINNCTIVMIVHETPSNPCSERFALKRWFAENGINLEEFNSNDEKETHL